MSSVVLLAGAVGFVSSALATVVVRGVARRIGFIDRPGGHKGHDTPIALGGGVALYLAICLPLLAGTLLAWMAGDGGPSGAWLHWIPALVLAHLEGVASKLPQVLAIVACCTVLLIVGLMDDRTPLGPAPKFAVQIAVALFTAAVMGIRAGEALGPIPSVALTVFWIVLITNAFNFLDNMDGLSAGVMTIAAVLLALTGWQAGQIFVPVLACVMAGGGLGFLLFNFSPASIFMGDAGSLVIGYLLSVLTILTTFYDPAQGTRPLGVIVPLVVLAVPLYDVTSVVIHRIRAGQSPLVGDRRHFSHRLQGRGMSTRAAVGTIYLATLATGLPAIALPRVDWPIAVLLLVQCCCVVLMIAILEHTGANADAPSP
ncbi:MAG: MraY family glycosyltransferase [Phycisphaerae bacterium]